LLLADENVAPRGAGRKYDLILYIEGKAVAETNIKYSTFLPFCKEHVSYIYYIPFRVVGVLLGIYVNK